MRRRGLAFVVLWTVTAADDAAAQRGRQMPPDGRPSTEGAGDAGSLGIRASREAQEKAGLIETGLQPVYPREATCPEISSPFAARTRFDGSPRRGEGNNGIHAGIDISAAEGTPLLAVADGVVIHKREAGMMAGIQIFLQHRPDETGLAVWLYSKYQHLAQDSPLQVGERVKAGQVIAVSGKTGTVGGHYGRSGYPHLHLSLYAGASAEYRVTLGGALPVDGKFVDPLALYAGRSADSHALRALPEGQKRVALSYKTADGRLVPADTRVVWPFLCAGR